MVGDEPVGGDGDVGEDGGLRRSCCQGKLKLDKLGYPTSSLEDSVSAPLSKILCRVSYPPFFLSLLLSNPRFCSP
jgi:hypothetical protein